MGLYPDLLPGYFPVSQITGSADEEWMAKVPKFGVPAVAVFISALSFAWLPFLLINKAYAIEDVSQLCLLVLYPRPMPNREQA